MILNYNGLQYRAAWEAAGVKLPKHDWKAMCAETAENPVWVHFGAGNIFRIFVAGLQQRLLNKGLTDKGIIAAETWDGEIIDRIYKPYDSLTLMVSLRPDGGTDRDPDSAGRLLHTEGRREEEHPHLRPGHHRRVCGKTAE